jgi:hypothetical protein
MIAMGVNEFDIRSTLNLVYISSTVLLIMLFGSAERVLVSAIKRVIGTVLGAGIGVLLGMGHGAMVKANDPKVVIYTYQILVLIAVVFFIAFLTRLFPAYFDMFLLFGITITVLLFAVDLTISYSRTASVLTAALSATIFTFLFQFTRAEDMIFRDHQEAAALLLDLAEYAVSSEHQEKHEFFKQTHRMRECLASSDISWEAYAIWCKWTCRKPKFNFGSLSEALRPLYYEVFSLYWSHVETPLRPRYAARLYCDSDTDYRRNFKPQIDSILVGIREYKNHIRVILDPQASHYHRRHAVENVLTIIAVRFYLNLERLESSFIENRFACFHNRYQRWNMTEYIETVACVVIELVEYTTKVVSIFITADDADYADLVDRLIILRDRINTVRFEAGEMDVVGIEQQRIGGNGADESV